MKFCTSPPLLSAEEPEERKPKHIHFADDFSEMELTEKIADGNVGSKRNPIVVAQASECILSRQGNLITHDASKTRGH